MKRMLRGIALLAIASVVVLVSAETMARLDDAVRMGTPFLASPEYNDLIMHDSLGIRGRPLAQYQKWRLNSAGFRGSEISRVPQPRCIRVAVIGASETFGYYESPGKEYPAQLADSLREKGCYEVVNAAIAGMSLPAAIQLWDNWVSRFRPDIVVLYLPPAFYLSEDPPHFAEPTHEGASPVPSRFALRLMDRLHDRIEYPDFIQRKRVAKSISREIAGKSDDWFFRTLPADRLALFRTHLDSLVTSIRATGAVPVLATHAMRFSDPPKASDADLLRSWRKFSPRATEDVLLAFERAAAVSTRELAHERGLPLADVADLMTGQTQWFADFTHFDDGGAGVAASVMARVIERLVVPRTAGGRAVVTGYGQSPAADYR